MPSLPVFESIYRCLMQSIILVRDYYDVLIDRIADTSLATSRSGCILLPVHPS